MPNIPIWDDLRVAIRAFTGTARARRTHRASLQRGVSIDHGLEAIRRRWPELKSPSQAEPVFVFSAGWRSGSTLLQRMILDSGDVFVWGEPYRHASLIDSLARQVQAFTDRWPYDRAFVDAIGSENLSQRWVANLYPSMQRFIESHIAFFDTLFEKPARSLGKTRWGLKEVSLTVEHARFLQWLYPCAKFIFLVRNPYNSYRSYRQWRCWYRTWPDQPVFTPVAFGRLWRELATDFVDHHADVGGLLVRYEDLHHAATRMRLQNYIGVPVADAAALPRIEGNHDQPKPSRKWLPRIEQQLLRHQVEPLATRLDYGPHGPAKPHARRSSGGSPRGINIVRRAAGKTDAA